MQSRFPSPFYLLGLVFMFFIFSACESGSNTDTPKSDEQITDVQPPQSNIKIWPQYVDIAALRARFNSPPPNNSYSNKPMMFLHDLAASSDGKSMTMNLVGFSVKFQGKTIETIQNLPGDYGMVVPRQGTTDAVDYTGANSLITSNIVLTKQTIQDILSRVPANQNAIVFKPRIASPNPGDPLSPKLPQGYNLLMWDLYWGSIATADTTEATTFTIGNPINGLSANPVPPYPGDLDFDN